MSKYVKIAVIIFGLGAVGIYINQHQPVLKTNQAKFNANKENVLKTSQTKFKVTKENTAEFNVPKTLQKSKPFGGFKNRPAETLLDEAYCKQANQTPYDCPSIHFSEKIVSDIFNYKSSWLDFCQKKYPYLDKIYEQSQTLSKSIEKAVTETIKKAQSSVHLQGFNDNIEVCLSEILPESIPGFSGTIYDYVEFSFDLQRFSEFVLKHGLAEDKKFFEFYKHIRGYERFPHPFKQTWHYGGCYLYGQYDWQTNFKQLEHGLNGFSKPYYQKKMIDLKANFFEVIFSGFFDLNGNLLNSLCICEGTKEILEKDINVLIDYFSNENELDNLERLKKVKRHIQNKDFKILSDKKNQCPVG